MIIYRPFFILAMASCLLAMAWFATRNLMFWKDCGDECFGDLQVTTEACYDTTFHRNASRITAQDLAIGKGPPEGAERLAKHTKGVIILSRHLERESENFVISMHAIAELFSSQLQANFPSARLENNTLTCGSTSCAVGDHFSSAEAQDALLSFRASFTASSSSLIKHQGFILDSLWELDFQLDLADVSFATQRLVAAIQRVEPPRSSYLAHRKLACFYAWMRLCNEDMRAIFQGVGAELKAERAALYGMGPISPEATFISVAQHKRLALRLEEGLRSVCVAGERRL